MAQHGLLFIINSIQGMHMKRVLTSFFVFKGVEYITCYFEEPNQAKENLTLFSCISRTKIILSKYRRLQASYESMPINQVEYLELMQPLFFLKENLDVLILGWSYIIYMCVMFSHYSLERKINLDKRFYNQRNS